MVADSFDNHEVRLSQKYMAQRNSAVEIFTYKVGATQIMSVLAPCRMGTCFDTYRIVVIGIIRATMALGVFF